jgi:hypothetical protein
MELAIYMYMAAGFTIVSMIVGLMALISGDIKQPSQNTMGKEAAGLFIRLCMFLWMIDIIKNYVM